MTAIKTADIRKQEILQFLADQPRRFSDIRAIAGSFRPIQMLLDEGLIEKMGVGVYKLAGRTSEWDSLSAFATRYPNAVACLDTAAAYHRLTTQNPYQIHAAFLYAKDAVPRTDELSVRAYRWREDAMTHGVEVVDVGGTPLKITSPARTVVDFLRFMSRKAESEHALEALRSYSDMGGDAKLLIKLAIALRCEKTVRPYTTMMMGGLKP